VIGILAATRSEAHFLLKHLRPVKTRGIYHYRGEISTRGVALFLTRPGVHSREQVRRFMRTYRFDAVISCGACASLTTELTHLSRLQIGAATSPDGKWLSFGNVGRKCMSVGHLVTDDATKALLRETSGADVLDMETYPLASIAAEKEFEKIPFIALRVVDDLAGEEQYLRKEQMLREMTVGKPTAKPALRDVIRLGIWDYMFILWRRHRVAKAIAELVVSKLDEVRP
jgi:nucleoside phosphorylase